MFMGYGFCLSAAFMVAKYVRDNRGRRVDTPMWGTVVWGGFALAMALTGWGLWRMEINPTYKAFLGVAWLFLISSAFTLAKTGATRTKRRPRSEQQHEPALLPLPRRRGRAGFLVARCARTPRPRTPARCRCCRWRCRWPRPRC